MGPIDPRPLALVLCLGIMACTSSTQGPVTQAQVQTEAANAVQTSVEVVQQLCPVFVPLAAPIIASNTGAVKVAAQYGAGVCDLATGQPVQGFKADANTGVWLSAITQSLAAAQAAQTALVPSK